MEAEITKMSIVDILEWKANSMLSVNPEYQRGEVWTKLQKQRLIDSVLRGYPLPLIYLHDKRVEVAGRINESYEVIDGQQRINALSEFRDGRFKLLNPAEESDKRHFPRFIAEQPCEWGGKYFSQLAEVGTDLQGRFLNTKLSVATMQCVPEQARDLFIRLQAGSPLNAQEKLDALPGKVTEFVLRIGGKPQSGYQGNEFFTRVMNMKPSRDRGNTRKLAAQMLMLYLSVREDKRFKSIKASELDEFYYNHLDMDLESLAIVRFEKILDELSQIFAASGVKPLKGHDAIHLMLLCNRLWDDFAPAWKGRLVGAYREFAKGVAEARGKKELDGSETQEVKDFWNYYQMARNRSDQSETIKRRHEIYMRHMIRLLGESLISKDPQRVFSESDREIVWYRDNQQCAHCGGQVSWEDVEIHHKDHHGNGGKTVLANAVLVHKECHRRAFHGQGSRSSPAED